MPPRIPLPIRVGLVVALLASLAYALLTARILLWLSGVTSVGLALCFIYLFYRLVVAVERVANKL